MKDLLEAGSALRPPDERWNPKMKEFIFGERNGIYIIDLNKTVKKFRDAERFVTNLAPTARRSSSSAPSARRRTSSPKKRSAAACIYVNQRWLGGLLTNFTTIQRSLGGSATRSDGHRRPLRHAVEEGDRAQREREAQAAEEPRRHPQMSRLPDAIFVVDTRKEKIAVDEARKLKIPVIGIVDTNCDPDEVRPPRLTYHHPRLRTIANDRACAENRPISHHERALFAARCRATSASVQPH
jgi:small subunit ribosomal protein S2